MSLLLRSLLAPIKWFLQGGGITLTLEQFAALPDGEGSPEVGAALIQCLHPRGCWSYCAGGYRYCLCCNRVRVRC